MSPSALFPFVRVWRGTGGIERCHRGLSFLVDFGDLLRLSPTRPSAMPSARPSARPSAKPSARPSAKPSAKPSARPSARPSAKPSARISARISASNQRRRICLDRCLKLWTRVLNFGTRSVRRPKVCLLTEGLSVDRRSAHRPKVCSSTGSPSI